MKCQQCGDEFDLDRRVTCSDQCAAELRAASRNGKGATPTISNDELAERIQAAHVVSQYANGEASDEQYRQAADVLGDEDARLLVSNHHLGTLKPGCGARQRRIPVADGRTCPHCGRVLRPKATETHQNFQTRKFCDRGCASSYAAARPTEAQKAARAKWGNRLYAEAKCKS